MKVERRRENTEAWGEVKEESEKDGLKLNIQRTKIIVLIPSPHGK